MGGLALAFLIVLTLILSWFPGMSLAESKPAEGLKTVKISWFAPSSLQIPLIASKKQFDREFGIKLELIHMTRASDAMQALLTGDLDVTFGVSLAAEIAVSKGAKVKGIMVAYYGGYKFALVTLDKTGITSAADLKGKTVAVPGLGAPPELFARMAAETNGIPSNSINLVQQNLSLIPAALRTGQVDAGVLFEPLLTGFMKKQKGVVVLTRGIEIPVINYGPTGYFVREDRILKDETLIYRVFLSLAKAQWYIRTAGSDSEEILAPLAKATKIPVPVLKPSAGKNIWDPRLKPVQIANILEEMKFFVNIGKLNATVPVSRIWYDGFYRKARIQHGGLFADLDNYLNQLKAKGIVFQADFTTE
jgi:NitT/TauT family transport system substrate-binding protein